MRGVDFQGVENLALASQYRHRLSCLARGGELAQLAGAVVASGAQASKRERLKPVIMA